MGDAGVLLGHLERGGQGRCSDSYNAQDSLPHNGQAPNVNSVTVKPLLNKLVSRLVSILA